MHLISNGQKAGFSLDELSKLLPSDLSDWKHDQLLNALRQKLADIELMEKKLADNKRQLNSILNDIEAKPGDMACADNAKRVISQMGMDKRRR
ncbi:MerR family DNA-binding protein [Pseudoalteromonas sp. M8]|uniref:MerR family DNA-binding protein n=1 Tax=Pseudoalteromonas sp. M8 TaxID=2692624 RepID=UPI00201325CE|nr:MerR family DNA-binding protein [Pseudoalteromonas sp. M8]